MTQITYDNSDAAKQEARLLTELSDSWFYNSKTADIASDEAVGLNLTQGWFNYSPGYKIMTLRKRTQF